MSFLKWPQIYEDTSLFQEHSIFPRHMFEISKKKNKKNQQKKTQKTKKTKPPKTKPKNQTHILKEVVITTRMYDKNVSDKSVGKEIICYAM